GTQEKGPARESPMPSRSGGKVDERTLPHRRRRARGQSRESRPAAPRQRLKGGWGGDRSIRPSALEICPLPPGSPIDYVIPVMFDEPHESKADLPRDPAVRAREKAEELCLHAEVAAVFEGPRKFDAAVRADLDPELARDVQRTM